LLAACSLALAALAFGLLQLRSSLRLRSELVRVQKENQEFRSNQQRFIELLREKKRQIDALKAQDTASTSRQRRPRNTKPVNTRVRPAAPLPPPDIETPKGIPYSVEYGPRSHKLLALTFDGGAHANAADAILDTLRSRRVRATMFLTGNFMRRYPGLVKRLIAEGHEVGNHTNRHPHLTTWEQDHTHTTRQGVTESMLRMELRRANKQFRRITGVDLAPIWRAPYGEMNRTICGWAQKEGYVHVSWGQGRTWRENLDTNDWAPNEHAAYKSPEEVYRKILDHATAGGAGLNGGILLLHLGTVRKNPEDQVHRILGRLIDDLRGQGYDFVPATVLIEKTGVDLAQLRGIIARTVKSM
jgi:peptidoglycan/xylan/chitin deacetylase (PgdA/CDA1 family)